MKIFKTKKYSILSNILKYSFVFVVAFMLIVPMVFAVDGVCGSANGQTFSTKPTTNLCSTGTNQTVFDIGNGWRWQCVGEDQSADKIILCNATKLDPNTGSDGSSSAVSDGSSANAPNINTKIDNPLGSGIDSIPKLIEAIINIVLMIGIPIIVLAIIYTGFLFVKAQGNPEQITKAKSALLYTLIGAALLLGAFVIANAIGKTVEEIKSST
ncbi:MAG: hypothetical protein JJE53_01955 [Candidatus Pacebacteria bacterium]|nr:hypothetical protein [Candidatus Paceibacterota bacterium]